MSEETIQQYISRFLESSDWGTVLEDTYGAGLCYDVSEDFRKWLASMDPKINAYLIFEKRIGLGRFKELYPQDAKGHWILIVGSRWLVDLSSKQFCEKLPLPYIVDVTHLISEW